MNLGFDRTPFFIYHGDGSVVCHIYSPFMRLALKFSTSRLVVRGPRVCLYQNE
jgi:hypothetical protein